MPALWSSASRQKGVAPYIPDCYLPVIIMQLLLSVSATTSIAGTSVVNSSGRGRFSSVEEAILLFEWCRPWYSCWRIFLSIVWLSILNMITPSMVFWSPKPKSYLYLCLDLYRILFFSFFFSKLSAWSPCGHHHHHHDPLGFTTWHVPTSSNSHTLSIEFSTLGFINYPKPNLGFKHANS